MVGTPKNIVAECAPTASSTSATPNFGSSTIEEPASSVPFTATPSPCMWNSGSAHTSRSAAVHSHACSSEDAPASRFTWLSTAPFGAPVVPEVKPISAGSPAPAASSVAGASGRPERSNPERSSPDTIGTPASARGRSSSAAAGRTSPVMCASSRSVYAVFAGTTTAPSRRMPR
jgi:hypothetical protein